MGAAAASTTRRSIAKTGGATTGDVYDNEHRLVSWNGSGGSGKEAYDGEGHRVAHSTTSGITTTTTYYVGNLEEVDAASGTVTKYYPTPAGTPAALRVGTGSVAYLATDGLGSVSEALDGSGNVTATALYGPYGQTRYSTGTMPTAKGYTGQRLDAASGLYYYNARYYDPATDQFASADSAAAGLNRYAYVAGNPETATDPTGHRMDCGVDCTGGGGNGGGTGNGTGSGGSGCTSDSNCGGCYSSCGSGSGGGSGGTGSKLDSLCTGDAQQCPPTPEPVPCANVQNQCSNTFPQAPGPSSGQIKKAKGEARLAIKEYQQFLDFLSRLDVGTSIAFLTTLLGVLGKDPTKGAGALAIMTALAEVLAATEQLQGAFKSQLSPDFDWSEVGMQEFSLGVHALEAAFVLAMSGLSLALARFAGDYDAGPLVAGGMIAGMVIGTTLTIGDLFPVAYTTIDGEWADLGYPPDDPH